MNSSQRYLKLTVRCRYPTEKVLYLHRTPRSSTLIRQLLRSIMARVSRYASEKANIIERDFPRKDGV
jgi:hypothetical protein